MSGGGKLDPCIPYAGVVACNLTYLYDTQEWRMENVTHVYNMQEWRLAT
jgi:hypothetical protein